MKEEILYYEMTLESIGEIYDVTGHFHDNYVRFYEYESDTIRLEIQNPWGSNIEFVFSGDVKCFIDLKEFYDRDDPSWWQGTILRENNSFYLIDHSCSTAEDIKYSLCWFCGKQLRYRWIPKE